MSTRCLWAGGRPRSGYAVFESDDGSVVRLDFDRVSNIETTQEYMDITSEGAHGIDINLTRFPTGDSVTTIRASRTTLTTWRNAPDADDDDLPDTPDLDMLF